MLLPNQHLLKTQIIDLFRKTPHLSATEIHRQLQTPCSLQAVYKELRSLMAENILQKVKTTYVLNAQWAIHLQAYAHALTQSCFSDDAGIPLLIRKKRQSWKFSNIFEMDDFWGHIFLYLARQCKKKHILTWNPYLFFVLFKNKNEQQFLNSLRLAGKQFTVIVGPDHFLNRWASKDYDKYKVLYRFTSDIFMNEMDTYYSIFDEHVITMRLAPETFQKLHDLYNNTESFKDFAMSDFSMFFTQQGHCTLTVEHSHEKANRLRRKFSRYFGEEF